MGSIFRFVKRLAGERHGTRPKHKSLGTVRYHRRLAVDRLEERQLLTVVGLGNPLSAGQIQTLADLPGAAQQAISSTIGQGESAYHAASIAAGASLTNPANGFTAELRSGALRVSVGLDTWDMALTGFSFGGATQPLSGAQTSINGNRVDCNYGAIDEWFINGPVGLEQGFTVAPGAQSDGSGALTLELALGGGLRGVANTAGDGLTLIRSDGSTALGYTGLTASDAAGKALPASLEVRSEGGLQELLIHVDTAGAQGPITIDPFVQSAKLTASDGAAHDYFGSSVSINGSTVVVGAPGASGAKGAAYVFVSSGSGWANMTQTAKLTASDGAADDSFGSSVSVSGNTVVVGAPGASNGQGAAYVFSGSGATWTQAKLTASDGLTGFAFGNSVSVDGATVVVGSPHFSRGFTYYAGAAYVFTQPSTGWANMTQTAELTVSSGAIGDSLGQSVAVSGSTVVVGAPNANLGLGAAYVYAKPGSAWTDMASPLTLTASDGAAGNLFGNSISIDGATVVVGASGATVSGHTNQGAAYVFTKSGAAWASMTQTAKLTASDGAANDAFGSSVAISGSTILVGSPNAAVGSNGGQGVAYYFAQPGSAWTNMTQTSKFTSSDGTPGNAFGSSVSISGNTPVVGANAVNTDQGTAYVFAVKTVSSIAGLSSTGNWQMAKSTGSSFVNQPWGSWSTSAGWQNVQAGDFTGDGKSDIVGMTSSGVWYVAVTNASGTGSTNYAWGSWNPSAGWQDVRVADVNGDGKADIIGRTSYGAWYAAISTGSSFNSQLWGSWSPNAGWQNVMVGDFDGDGKADIVGKTSYGAWYVALSSSTGSTSYNWGAWDPAAGWQNVMVGDFNHDGKVDIVGRTSFGGWYVAVSSGTSFNTLPWGSWNPGITWIDVQVGDVNGDGMADIVGRTSWGTWYAALSTGSSFNSVAWGTWNPSAGWQDVTVADFDGDGRADIAGMTSSGQWYVAVSNSSGTGSVSQYWCSWDPSAGWQPVLVGAFG
jgi:hypothetical protein